LDGGAHECGVSQEHFKGGNLGDQGFPFVFEFDAGELGQATQTQFQNVLSLFVAQTKHALQLIRRGLRIVGRSNDGDNLVDIEDGNQKTFHEVQAGPALVEAIGRSSRHHADAMVEVDLKQLPQPQRLRLTFHQGD
jgi:hypothetical protein